MSVTRAQLTGHLTSALGPLSFVYAAWLEGADAAGRADEYSDLDLWLDVDARRVPDTFKVVQQVLETFGPLDVEHRAEHPDPMLHQRFFRSTGLPRFWFLDVVVQEHGRDMTFGLHDPVLVLFDRAQVIRLAEADALTITQLQALQARHWRWLLVEKEVRRGHRLEALSYFHSLVLGDLVTLLRLRFCPGKAEYGLKHIEADLPPLAVRKLETFYATTELVGLPGSLEEAEGWYAALTDELNSKSVTK